MATTREKWQEIANRGLQDRFDPQTRAKFDEAVKRGLITITQQAPQQPLVNANVVQQPQAPQQDPTLGEQVLGGLENVGALASSIVAEPVAGLAGIAQSLNPFADEGAGARAVEATREALTFTPQTETGQAQQQAIGETLAPVGEALSGAERFLGDETLKLTGSPALASMAHTLPSAALEILGVKGARRATAIKDPSEKLIKKTLVESAPEAEQVRKASSLLFKEVDESGAVVKKSSLGKLNNALDSLAKKEGIREGVSDPVFRSINAIKKDIGRGTPIPINEITDLRKIAQNAASPTDANISRQAGLVLDEVDSFIDGISTNDLTRTGNIKAKDISKKLRDARKLYGRAKRAEMLEGAITMGASRKAGIEKGIRNELNNLINRKKSNKFLTKEDIAAIRKVTDGDFKQNFSSLVGGMGLKLENSPSMFNALISGAGTGGLAASLGMSGAALPLAIGAVTTGTVSKQIANKLARGSANFLKTMQLAGNDAQKITKAYLRAVPKNKRSTSDLSDLLLDPSVDLGTLENIANETVKDAIKAAQFKRELLQASAALGAGASLENEVSSNESQ